MANSAEQSQFPTLYTAQSTAQPHLSTIHTLPRSHRLLFLHRFMTPSLLTSYSSYLEYLSRLPTYCLSNSYSLSKAQLACTFFVKASCLPLKCLTPTSVPSLPTATQEGYISAHSCMWWIPQEAMSSSRLFIFAATDSDQVREH